MSQSILEMDEVTNNMEKSIQDMEKGNILSNEMVFELTDMKQ